MNEFKVIVEYMTTSEVSVLAESPDEALEAALVEVRAADPNNDPVSASVLDSDDMSGNGMPLTEWFAE